MLRLPFLETGITIKLGDVHSISELIRRIPDLADRWKPCIRADRKDVPCSASSGNQGILKGSTGQPLLEQALLAATALVEMEGIAPDFSGRMLTDVLIAAEKN